MRFVTIASLLLLLFVGASQAVGIHPGGGINVGLGMSTMSFDPKPDFTINSRLGLVAGGFGDLDIETGLIVVGFRLGLNYEMKGFKTSSTYGTLTTEATARNDYLMIPLRFKLGFDTPVVVPFIAIEPALGILLQAKVDASSAGRDTTVDQKDLYESTDFCLGFGGGVDLKLGGPKVGIYAKYVLGLSDVDKSDYSKAKNNSFQILATVGF